MTFPFVAKHPGARLKLSDYVAEFVAKQNIGHVFMVPGGGAMHLDDSFFHHPGVETVSNLHEQPRPPDTLA